MAIKRVNENPTIADQIIFDILTPIPTSSVDECYLQNPYKVDEVRIFFVERSFTSSNFGEYNKKIYDPNLEAQLDAAKSAACAAVVPTTAQLEEIASLQTQLDASVKVDSFYYKDAVPVAIFGTPDHPAWLSTELVPSNQLIVNIPFDSEGNPLYGHFELTWNPLGMREGDYFMCWIWTPYPGGSKLSAHIQFFLGGSTQFTTSIPTHFTKPEKYETLLERYLPEMFKMHIAQVDLTPEVLQEFNQAVAKGFTFLEDQTNQIVDLIDANATHESILPFLSNLFNLKLKSSDPTLWRRQIKRAIPLFKKKGTLNGLAEAMSQAGIKLLKYTKLWQVISPYTYQESFSVQNDGQDQFILTKLAILPIDLENFNLYFRPVGDSDWLEISPDYVTLENINGKTIMTWRGNNLSVNPIDLLTGDCLRIIYLIHPIPGPAEQIIEKYIRTLSLSDSRDTCDNECPKMNWNVRLIEEDDPLFDLIIPFKHPFYDPLIFGRIRTEIPYSENIYNAEEYNGSTRDSTEPCHIDCDFLDPCNGCLSSKYNITLGIEQISNERIQESQDVLREFTPFHAVLHSMNLVGVQMDLVNPPNEQIYSYVRISGEEITLADPPQMIFNRVMETAHEFKRNELANVSTAASGTAIAYNESIVLFSPDARLDQINLSDTPALTWLEVLAPSLNAGTYELKNPSGHHAELDTPISEPLVQTSFSFRISNEVLKNTTSSINPSDIFIFKDPNMNFAETGLKTQWDADHGGSGGVWKISIPGFSGVYDILNIFSDDSLSLKTDGTLPLTNTSNITYSLTNSVFTIIKSGTTGRLEVTRKGTVDMSSGAMLYRGYITTVNNIADFIKIGDYALITGDQYLISGFVEGSPKKFIIDNWTSGSMSGQTVVVYERKLDQMLGYFHYKGMKLDTSPTDQETALGILNGTNAPPENSVVEDNRFKENFLILIGMDYYSISEIDGTTITISGPAQDWTTFTAGGTSLGYTIYKYTKTGPHNIPAREYYIDADPPELVFRWPGHEFPFLDRRGNEVFTYEVTMAMNMSANYVAKALNSVNKDQMLDTTGQTESIKFQINWKEE